MIHALFLVLALVATPEEEIRAVLDRQAEAWNRGDISGFMEGYLPSESITFLGRAGVTRGFAATKARYERDYPTPARMGRLTFSELEIRLLDSRHALVLGKFSLERSPDAGGPASGRYTLVFEKTAKGWKILHDHTS
jgi:beta-aspartyl-peptidase (threonine type)